VVRPGSGFDRSRCEKTRESDQARFKINYSFLLSLFIEVLLFILRKDYSTFSFNIARSYFT
jgi:hypothetical protein